jgi:hypothetical protein
MSYSTHLDATASPQTQITDSKFQPHGYSGTGLSAERTLPQPFAVYSNARGHSPEQRQRDDRRNTVADHTPVNGAEIN